MDIVEKIDKQLNEEVNKDDIIKGFKKANYDQNEYEFNETSTRFFVILKDPIGSADLPQILKIKGFMRIESKNDTLVFMFKK